MREEGSIAELLQRVEKIAAEGKEEAAKVTCQADLDHEAAVQQGREVEMERLRGESKVRERSSELRKDS